MGNSFSRYDINESQNAKIKQNIERTKEIKNNFLNQNKRKVYINGKYRTIEELKDNIIKERNIWMYHYENYKNYKNGTRYHPENYIVLFEDILNNLIYLKEKLESNSFNKFASDHNIKDIIKNYIKDLKKEIKNFQPKDKEKKDWNKIIYNLEIKYRKVFSYF